MSEKNKLIKIKFEPRPEQLDILVTADVTTAFLAGLDNNPLCIGEFAFFTEHAHTTIYPTGNPALETQRFTWCLGIDLAAYLNAYFNENPLSAIAYDKTALEKYLGIERPEKPQERIFTIETDGVFPGLFRVTTYISNRSAENNTAGLLMLSRFLTENSLTGRTIVPRADKPGYDFDWYFRLDKLRMVRDFLIEAPNIKIEEVKHPKEIEVSELTIFWCDGRREVVKGSSAAEALKSAGYGPPAFGAINLIASGDCQDYVWSGSTWVKK